MERYKSCLKGIAFNPLKSRRKSLNVDQDGIFFKAVGSFIIDQMKILQSKAYRRLNEKTQVFYQPDNPHVRTRSIHTSEVHSLSVIIASFLGLNVDLTRAIALAHDIGHTPYGHVGERFLSDLTGKRFKHNAFGVLVVNDIEREGKGLNLTSQTEIGIFYHSGFDPKEKIDLPECAVVRISDKICNTFSDINDALRFGYIKEEEIPSCFKELGSNQRNRVASCLCSLFEESYYKREVSFSEMKEARLFLEATEWMYENIYPRANERITEEHLVSAYRYLENSPLFKDYHLPTVFALMTEEETEMMWSLYKKSDFDTTKIGGTGIMEILLNLEKGREYDPSQVRV